MVQNCAKTCCTAASQTVPTQQTNVTSCSGQTDNSAYTNACVLWARNGYCTAADSFMRQNCPLSCCIYRPTVSTCSGTDVSPLERCNEWATEGYCTNSNHTQYMEANCSRTCCRFSKDPGACFVASFLGDTNGIQDCAAKVELAGGYHCSLAAPPMDTYLADNCKLSCCEAKQSCQDTIAESGANYTCEQVADSGWCVSSSSDYKFASRYCQKTCGQCGLKVNTCGGDVFDACQTFKDLGYCEGIYTDWMQRYCSAACCYPNQPTNQID